MTNYSVTSNDSIWKVSFKGADLSFGGIVVLNFITYGYSVSISDFINISVKLPLSTSSIPFNIKL